MKKSVAVLGLVLLLTAAAFAIPFWMPCQLDDLDSRWAGAYEYIDGVRVAILKYIYGGEGQR
jgi:hypothetical protein